MNILIHYYRLGHYIGGAEVVALNQCSEILRQGHNVTILTADTGHHSKIFDEFLENNPKIKLVELLLEQIHKTGDSQSGISGIEKDFPSCSNLKKPAFGIPARVQRADVSF